jgi:hypothetical protein
MTRFRLVAALALLLVAPGAAQVTRPVIQPVVISPLPQIAPLEVDDNHITKVMTLEEANALIAKLKEERREKSLELRAALERINEMTRFGGSLVQAYCTSDTMSRNSAGASEDCAAGGYNCDRVSGLCHRRAAISDHCAEGFLFNANACVTPGSMVPPPE